MPETYTQEQIDEAWKSFVNQPIDGILYDLDLLPECLDIPCQNLELIAKSVRALKSALSTAERERDALKARCAELEAKIADGTATDGYHSFNELYEYRMLYNAALFNEWASLGKYHVHKSIRHSDGQECFGGGWFIVVAILPTGQITNHYKLEYWDLFKIPEAEKAIFQYDGHTPQDAAERLRAAILDKKEGL